MAYTFSIPLLYKDTGDSNRVKLLTGQTNVKLQPAGSTYPSGALALTETGSATGIYKHDTVPGGDYKLYNNDAQVTDYGTFPVGTDLSGLAAIYAKLAGGNAFTGNQAIAGELSVSSEITVGGGIDITAGPLVSAAGANMQTDITAREFFMNTTKTPYTTGTPTYDASLVWKSWVVAQIAAISLSPYQESTNFRRCIPNGSNETNKVYTTLRNAALSFASPGINNQCNVFIPGTGSSSRYITAMPGTQIDYVNFTGAGRHINLILTDGAANVKITKFENLTIFLGANDYTTDRTMSNKTFINCTIYAWKNTTYTDCVLINCRFIHASTFKVFITGATIVENCYCNNEYDKSALTTGYVAGFFGIDVTTLPTDPSTGIPSEE